MEKYSKMSTKKKTETVQSFDMSYKGRNPLQHPKSEYRTIVRASKPSYSYKKDK